MAYLSRYFQPIGINVKRNLAITIRHLRAKYPRFIFSLFIHSCYALLATFARNWDCGFLFMETDLLILLLLLIKRLRKEAGLV